MAWLVILGVVGVLAAAVVVPRLAGATPYTVLTGSMRPSYPPGTLVVVKPVKTNEIKVGDVVTYQIESGKPTVVTHRVTEVAVGLDGKTVFSTKGDDNGSVDRDPVQPVQIQGKLWYSIPYLGYVNKAITGSQRQTAVLVVSAGLIGYAVFMLVGAFRDRRRKRTAAVLAETGDTQQDDAKGAADDHITSPVIRTGRADARRTAALAAGAGLAIALAFGLIRARRGRSNDRAAH
ncbi:signal peptidase I [Nocardioides sp. Root190]|uniref:signal peptidase I n=1 Tax=Nocardioides sp. Root190 TaxID=1736488 RepID=UPI001F285FB1|nr:signal peptidase I [Nocardioides sp. Root190]